MSGDLKLCNIVGFIIGAVAFLFQLIVFFVKINNKFLNIDFLYEF